MDWLEPIAQNALLAEPVCTKYPIAGRHGYDLALQQQPTYIHIVVLASSLCVYVLLQCAGARPAFRQLAVCWWPRHRVQQQPGGACAGGWLNARGAAGRGCSRAAETGPDAAVGSAGSSTPTGTVLQQLLQVGAAGPGHI